MARFSTPLPVVTLTSLALVLTACGGGEAQKNTQVPETPFTPPAATSSASAPSSAAPSAQAAASSAAPVALPTLASGKTVEFTPEELAAYQKGEYVPASEKHPAYNVPVPVMPEVAKTQTLEGAVAFAEYWRDSFNYAVQTGDTSFFNSVSDREGMVTFSVISDHISSVYGERGWMASIHLVVIPSNSQSDTSNSGSQRVNIEYRRAGGKTLNADGSLFEEVPNDENLTGLVMTLHWVNNSWLVVYMSGV